MSEETFTEEEFNAFCTIKDDVVIAGVVIDVYHRGFKDGKEKGINIGYIQGHSTMSYWWFPIILIVACLSSFAFGAIMMSLTFVAK